jgi:CRISPR-associated protein Csb1
VQKITRSAQYFPAIQYGEAGVAAAEGEKELNRLSEEGMAEVPSVGKPGGVVVRGEIRRDVSVNLCTLKDLTTEDGKEAVNLRRYLLGLTLVAMTQFEGKAYNLRQGCQLVRDPGKKAQCTIVNVDGSETAFAITPEEALAFAKAAAEVFGVGRDRTATFNATEAKESLKADKEAKGKKAGKGKPEAPASAKEDQ